MPVLEMRDAAFRRDGRTLLHPVSVSLEAGAQSELGCESALAAGIAARLATGVVKCTSGTVFICDFDPKIQPVHVKALVGLVPHAPPRSPFSARRYFAYRAALWGLPEREGCARGMTLLSMLDGLDRNEKLALAGALLHSPKLLVLERPGQGLKAAAEALLDGAALFVTYGPSDRAMALAYENPATAGKRT